MYNELVIGIDQSYKNTGISLIADGVIKDIKSIRLGHFKCHSERRNALRTELSRLARIIGGKAHKTVCMAESARIHGGGNSYINVDAIKAMGALSALIVDVFYPYGIPVYTVDTRAWKSAVVGTSKGKPNPYGVPDKKWPTVQWVIQQGFEDKILIDVTGTRKTKGTFARNGHRYMYNDDAADSTGIGMFWFAGDHKKLKVEK